MHIRVGTNDGDFVGDTNRAIQQAVDAAGAYGGGTVEVLAGVYVDGHTTELLFQDCAIRDTRSGPARTQRIGIWAGPNSARVKAVRCRIENNVEAEVQGEVAVEG